MTLRSLDDRAVEWPIVPARGLCVATLTAVLAVGADYLLAQWLPDWPQWIRITTASAVNVGIVAATTRTLRRWYRPPPRARHRDHRRN